MNLNDKIFVAGHRGMVGSAILRKLKSLGFKNIVTKTKSELDLTNQYLVDEFFFIERPDYVFLAAAKVGGIKANNDYKADFIYENLQIQTNIIYSAFKYKVTKLIFLGSSCIYPKFSLQPIKEEYLLSGPLEPTNDAYAVAKIAGIKMCQAFNEQYSTNFISVMPCNLYGIGDNYHSENSHVFPALIRKFHEAKINCVDKINLWGDGTPMREFLCSDDLADAVVFLMNSAITYELINVGFGSDVTIKELAEKVRDIIHPTCSIEFNGEISMNGTPRKLMDNKRITKLGWNPTIGLEDGIRIAYNDYLSRF